MIYLFKFIILYFYYNFIFNKLIFLFIRNNYKFGDWGLGIGDWAQSPIPNPQSPIPNKIDIIIKLI